MNLSSSQLKRIAKGKLSGNYATPMGALAIIMAITLIASIMLTLLFNTSRGITFPGIYLLCTLIISLFTTILSTGLCQLSLNLMRDKELKINDLFYGFRNCPDRIIILSALLFFLSIACMIPLSLVILLQAFVDTLIVTLLLIVAILFTIILSAWVMLTYSQVYYIYVDNPHMKSIDILRASKALMKGNKGRLFYLQISFIGLLILSIFTCYIGFLWLGPYMNATNAAFHLNLKGEL